MKSINPCNNFQKVQLLALVFSINSLLGVLNKDDNLHPKIHSCVFIILNNCVYFMYLKYFSKKYKNKKARYLDQVLFLTC